MIDTEKQRLERRLSLMLVHAYIHEKLLPESIALHQQTVDSIDRAQVTRARCLRQRHE